MVSQAGAPVDTRGFPMCETCTKQVSIPALEREKIMYSAWNSAKTDNWTTLPSNVSYFYFSPLNICLLSIPFFYSHRGEKNRDI
ncbi:hypothetical protein AB205_0199610 [Aquarana catesbeiana]|uniref:Uncharacterized protein n=1 Tax=Aquarana catesbeiana TaxID=8400 RepID=A0A2G9SKJ0_AQUCT|nr:hypothetical protein AB205_0199610 [Aquarana catesbeiana]